MELVAWCVCFPRPVVWGGRGVFLATKSVAVKKQTKKNESLFFILGLGGVPKCFLCCPQQCWGSNTTARATTGPL